jgi:hypothetical protein
MFPIQLSVLENKPPDITLRDWASIRRATYEAMGAHWYAHMLPEHFKANAHHVYGYRRRTKATIDRKKKGGRGLHPAAATMQLTHSGLLHMSMTTRGRVIKAYPSRFTVKMPGLPYTPKKQRTTKQPFLQGEITKLLKREIDVLKRIGKAKAVELINQTRQRRATKL